LEGRGEERQKRALSYTLRLLKFRIRTEKELMERMRSKGFEEGIIQLVIADLKESGFLNDEEFAREFTRAKIEKLWHPRLILRELLSKGVSMEVAEEVIGEVDIEDLIERARERASILIQRSKGDRRKAKRKVISFFLRRGFPMEMVKEILP